MNCTETLHYSADVAGVGVRLSFYIQNFILVLLVKRSPGDTENALWTFIATSFGLTVAALGQVGNNNNLTLLDGILVSQLSWLANIGTFLALASYSRSRGEDRVVKFAAVLQGYFSMVLTIVMWTYCDTFKSSDCNNAIQFVFFFAVQVPAVNTGRVVALVFASLAMVVYTVLTFTECLAWLRHGKSMLSKGEVCHDVEMAPKTADRAHRGSVSTPRGGNFKYGRKKHRYYRQKWLVTNVDPIFLGIMLFQIVIFAYFISTTELIIWKSNATPDSPGWAFGQVLALTVIMPSVVALWRAARSKLQREKEKNKERNVPPHLRRGFRENELSNTQANPTPDL